MNPKFKDPHEAYKFHPTSGKQLTVVNKGYLKDEDDLPFYINPVTAAPVIIKVGNEIMLNKRNREPYKGSWDLVGGIVDIEETIEECAVREVKEEIGLEVSQDRLEYFGSYTSRYPFKYANLYIVDIVFLLELDTKPEIKLNDPEEFEVVQYFEIEDLPIAEIPIPSIRQVMVELRERA